MNSRKPRVEIEYCSQCRFILRASWFSQELLTTFADELGEVALVPGGGGIFEVRLNGERLWNKKEAGRFPSPRKSNSSSATVSRQRKIWDTAIGRKV